MFKKAIHFIKYNNATVLILVVIFIIGSGAWAQTEAGQEFIGEQQIFNEGVDNILLLEADLDNFDMEFRIERVEEDDNYFYVTYTYMNLAMVDDAWQYQVQEAIRKVSKSLKKDLGIYLAEELEEEYEQRIKELRQEQTHASELGVDSTRVEVSEYSGLIGTSLDLVGRVFDGYEPVKTREIPTPSVPPSVLLSSANPEALADSLTDVYQEYVDSHDPDRDDVFGILDNCPDDFNPEQEDKDDDGIGDVCDPYFTLTPEEEATSTESLSPSPSPSTGEGSQDEATSSDDIAEDIGTTTVEIIELPIENATSTE